MRGGRCWKNFPFLVGDGTKISPSGDIFHRPPCERSSIRVKLADHVGDHLVLSPEGAVLVTSPGGNRRILPPIVERFSCYVRVLLCVLYVAISTFIRPLIDVSINSRVRFLLYAEVELYRVLRSPLRPSTPGVLLPSGEETSLSGKTWRR